MNWRKHLPVTAAKWDRMRLAWSEYIIAKAELRLVNARLRQLRVMSDILDKRRTEAKQ